MKNILAENGINEALSTQILEALTAQGVESINDIAVLSDTDIKKIVAAVDGTNLVIVNKVLAILREEYNNATTYSPTFESLPANLVSPINIKVTSNVTADIPTMIKLINILNLHNMGIEDIAAKLSSVVTARFNALEVGATEDQLKIFATVNKFTSIDDSMYRVLMDKLNIAGSLVDCRHEVIASGNDTFIPSLITFINDALDLGQNVSNMNLEVVRRVLGVQKIGAQANLEDLTMAANQFISVVNKSTRGLNSVVITETHNLYHELYELLESKELQAFLGVNSKEDLLREMGVSITPKQARVYSELPGYIFTLVNATTNDQLKVNENLYKYLQTAWSAMRTLDIMGVVPAEQKVSKMYKGSSVAVAI